MRHLLALLLLLALAAPAGAKPTLVRSGTGPDAAAIQAVVDAFRAETGGLNSNTPGEQAAGRREINWDGVPDAFASPATLPGDFFNVNSPRGVLMSSPGTLQVSADSSNPSSTPVRFANLQAGYETAFDTFSPQRLFGAPGANTVDVEFVVAGSSTPARVHAFGVVFTGVQETVAPARVQLYGAAGGLLGEFAAPGIGEGSLSFVGIRYADPIIRRVRIVAGGVPLGSAAVGAVAMDDFVYGEPHAFADADADSVPDGEDNCPAAANTGQANLDGDALGDDCDGDVDGDGVANGSDAFPRDPSAWAAPPPSPPAADTTAPVISSLRVARLRRNRASARAITLALSEPARLLFVVERLGRFGRVVGTLRAMGDSGNETLPFPAKVARRALRVGRYRLRALAVDHAGNISAERSALFTVRK